MKRASGWKAWLQNAACLAALVISAFAPAIAQTQPVRTTEGWVAGMSRPEGIEIFKGIPFAAPPIGKLRWQPPQPPAAWQGVREARDFEHPCMQALSPKRLGPWTTPFLSKLQPSEDCLYLNVWAAAKKPAAPRPVMVYIYGGGFTSGAGSVAVYDGSKLAAQGVVAVDFNYRVGPFGFLATPGLTAESPHHSSGNYALLDQMAALRWVKQNIAAFGGDPHQVTIFGQSAGAFSVWLLMQSPLAEGLFERAVIMSGPGVIPLPPTMSRADFAAAEKEGEQFAAHLGASSLKQLRALPAAKIVQAGERTHWAPIADGWVLRPGWHPPREVEAINGMVADDIGIGYYGNGPAPAMTMAVYHERMQALCGNQAAACKKLYPASSARDAAAAIRAALQDRARVSLYKWAVSQSRLSSEVYLYYFNREIPWPQHPEYRVFHSSELPYVFENLQMLHRPWQNADFRVSDIVSAYWTDFAKTGNPSGDNLPPWPAFNPHSLTIMQLGVPMEPIPLASSARQHFWMEYLKAPIGFYGDTPF